MIERHAGSVCAACLGLLADPDQAQDAAQEIPQGYRLIDGIDLAVDEDHCIEGLRIYADVAGRYPSCHCWSERPHHAQTQVRDHGPRETVGGEGNLSTPVIQYRNEYVVSIQTVSHAE